MNTNTTKVWGAMLVYRGANEENEIEVMIEGDLYHGNPRDVDDTSEVEEVTATLDGQPFELTEEEEEAARVRLIDGEGFRTACRAFNRLKEEL